MSQNRNEVTDAVLAFVKVQSRDDSKSIVEERRDVLLTDAADDFLAYLRTRYRGDEELTRDLEKHVALLARCRREGIDAAFASYSRLSAATRENELEALIEELSNLTAPGDMLRRIAVCREALALVDRSDQPEWWAELHVELGNSLGENPQGDSAENIEEAMSHYEQALEVYTRLDFPVDWARIQYNLGLTYGERIRGDRAQNMEEAIRYFKLALDIYTREDFPMEWADTQNNLAVAYRDRIRGDEAQNIQKATSHREQAREVYNRGDYQ